MLHKRMLPTLLVGCIMAVLSFNLAYPISYAVAQNVTTDDGLTTETTDDGLTTETTDDGLTTETTDDGLTTDPSMTTGIKASLIIQVDVVGGTAEASDFVIQVSSTGDNSIRWTQFPTEPFRGEEAGTTVTLRALGMPSSGINYVVEVVQKPNDNYSPQYEGCSGSWELGRDKTCKITNYYSEPTPDFEIVANPEELTIIPESSGYSTLTLIPSQDNTRDAIIDIDLDTEWVNTPPSNDDVSVTLERDSTRLVGTERQDIDVTIQANQDVLPGQTLILRVIADGEVDQQDQPLSYTTDIQITIPPSDNTPPEAIVVLDKEQVEEGGTVNLDGTQSSDPDGDELSYLWEIISGPANVQISDEDSTVSAITFETPIVNEDAKIMFQLTVSDGKPGGIGIDRTELRIDDLGTSNNPNTGTTSNNPNTGTTSNNPNTGTTSNNPQNGDHRSGSLIDAIPVELRDAAGGLIPQIAEPSNNNMFSLFALIAILVIGGIALVKYKMNRGSNRGVNIPPSALVEIKAKGGISR